MIFKRNIYGMEEEIDATVGSSQIKYKLVKKGCRQGQYHVEFENGIPYIKRYGKKLYLEGFTTTDGKTRTLTLGAYLQKKRNSKEPVLYSFMDYQQFIYMNTICNETIIKEMIEIAKNITKNETQAKSKVTPIVKIIGDNLKKLDENAIVINGFNAKRIR